jgi:hypothetical protein
LPKPVIRVKPEENQTTWENGKEFVGYRVGNFEVYVAYHGIENNLLAFDIEIINYEGEPILVSPEKMMLYPGVWDYNKKEFVFASNPYYAKDPEMELLQIDLDYSKSEAAQKNAETAIEVGSIAAVIGTAMLEASLENSLDENTPIVSIDIESNTQISSDSNYVEEINNEDYSLKYRELDPKFTWERESLRKTTLSAGNSVRGNVHFPIPKQNVGKIKLVIPLSSNNSIEAKYYILRIHPQ